jgi:uncharacterized protein
MAFDPWSELEMIAVIIDDRFDYGEERYRAFGRIGRQAYCLVFTVRDGEVRPDLVTTLPRKGDLEI